MVAMKDQYSICFRPNTGSCGVAFRVDSGTTTPSPFCLPSTSTSGSPAGTSQASTTAPCTTNGGSRGGYCDVAGISFPGLQANDDTGTQAHNKMHSFICGTNLNPMTTATSNTVVFNKGYIITVIGTSSTTVLGANGFKLNFQQTCQ